MNAVDKFIATVEKGIDNCTVRWYVVGCLPDEYETALIMFCIEKNYSYEHHMGGLKIDLKK